LLTETEKKGFK